MSFRSCGCRALAIAALAMFMTGCATGPSNVVVNVAAEPAPAGPGAGSRGTVRIDPVKDARLDATGAKAGERTGLGNMSMGWIETNPPPAVAVTNAIRAELAAMGLGVSDAADVPRVSAQLVKFQVTTPATALYWDINGAVELALSATRGDGKKYDARYAVQCTGRTYSWPGEEVIGGVIAACLKDLRGKMSGDAALAEALANR